MEETLQTASSQGFDSIKNLTKLGCHLGCCTYYLKIAHYLPRLIFLELTSLCGDWSNDQRTHLLGILSCFGVLIAAVSFPPFLFVMNHHLSATSGEARLEVTSEMSEMIVPSLTLTTGTKAPGSRKWHGCLSLASAPAGSQPPNPVSPSPLHMISPPSVSHCCPRSARPEDENILSVGSHSHLALARVTLVKHSSD